MSTSYNTPKQGMGPLAWVAIGCGGCAVVVVIIFAVMGVFLYGIGSKMQKGMLEYAENFKGVDEAQEILLAMHNYLDANGTFPPAYTIDADGKPLHSWRVLLLPYFEGSEEKALYAKIRLDEPWDSEHNKQFHSQMPMVYRAGFDTTPASTGNTSFAWVVGENTISDGPTSKTLANMSDGSSSTAVLFETRRPICWMTPEDLSLDDVKKGISTNDTETNAGISSHTLPKGDQRVCLVGTADGSIHLIKPDISPEMLQNMVIINDGKAVNWDAHTINLEAEMEKLMRESLPFQK